LRTAHLLSDAEQTEVYENIVSMTKGRREFYFFIFFSSVIATFGLLIDSAAVTIGAMIIAPLMTPILVISMGVVREEMTLIKKGLKFLIIGSIFSLIVAYLSLVPIPDVKATKEILARAEPTLYDLIIALTAGAAGAYATAKSKMFMSLPGVAIAVALMPPLVTTGIGLFMQDPYISLGSFLLFLTNLGGINLGGIGIFLWLGFGRNKRGGKTAFLRHLKFSVLLVLILAIPLAYLTYNVIYKSRIDNIVNSTLNSYLDVVIPDSEVDDLVWYQEHGTTSIRAIIHSEHSPDRKFAESLKETFEENVGTPVIFTLEIIPIQVLKVK